MLYPKSTLSSKSKTSRLVLALALSVYCQTLQATVASPAQVDSDEQKVERIENKLFFHAYADKDINWRLSHIEKQTFGKMLTGTVAERLDRIVSVCPIEQAAVSPSVEATKPAPIVQSTQPAKAPDDQDCLIQRAQVEVAAAREEEANKILAQGVSLWRQGRALDSRAKFEEALRISPNNAEANYSIGIIEEASGSLAEALSSYHKALDTNPENVEYQQACSTVAKKLAQDPNMGSLRVQVRTIAQAALKAYTEGNYQQALNLYLTLDEKVPNQALTKYNIGTIYLLLQQKEQALAYLKEATNLDPMEARYIRAYRHAATSLSTKNFLAKGTLTQPQAQMPVH